MSKSDRDKAIEIVCKNLNKRERIIVKLFKRLFEKVYHQTRIKIVNQMLER